jgi:hypothetical protein
VGHRGGYFLRGEILKLEFASFKPTMAARVIELRREFYDVALEQFTLQDLAQR